MPTLLTLDQILNAPDIEELEIEVPEWGGSVRIKAFSKARQQAIRREAMVDGQLDPDRTEMLMFIYGVVSPAMTPEHYAALREKSAGAIDRVLQAVLTISGMAANTDAVAQAEAAFRR